MTIVVVPAAVVLPLPLAARLAPSLRRAVEDARRAGVEVAPDVAELVELLDAVRRAEAATRSADIPQAVPERSVRATVTVTQYAARLGVTPRAIRARCGRGTLEAWHDGRRWHITPEETP